MKAVTKDILISARSLSTVTKTKMTLAKEIYELNITLLKFNRCRMVRIEFNLYKVSNLLEKKNISTNLP